jgi:GMP synthase (glutamine-hydrolysing)
MRGLLALTLLMGFGDAIRAAGTNSQDQLWTQIYDRPHRLTTLDHPAIVYLDIQLVEVIRGGWSKLADPLKQANPSRMRERFKALSGLECLVVHRSEVSGADLDRPQIKAILISGRNTTDVPPEDGPFYGLIQNTKIPMIGFCGGGQLIGKAYGLDIARMRRLREGEKDPLPRYHPGFFKEWGFLKVRIVRPDPLFAGLQKEIVVKEAHAFQLPEVPPGFDLLASTPDCRVQAIKHRERMVYGVQFHPEQYDDTHPDGRAVLENFFRLALKK